VLQQFKRCENLPTKKQLQATIARLLKQPATKIASGVKAVPRKLAYGIKVSEGCRGLAKVHRGRYMFGNGAALPGQQNLEGLAAVFWLSRAAHEPVYCTELPRQH